MSRSASFYGLSDKYLQRLQKDTLLNVMITLMFFFVFNVLFKDHPNYGIIRIIFCILFPALAVGVAILNHRRVRRGFATGFTVEKDGLRYCDGKQETIYPWHHFTKVTVNPNRMSLPYPFEFYTKEGMFVIHRQLADPEKLIPVILKQIRPYAEIDEKIPETINPNDNWMKDLGRMI